MKALLFLALILSAPLSHAKIENFQELIKENALEEKRLVASLQAAIYGEGEAPVEEGLVQDEATSVAEASFEVKLHR